jgi:hypothetical protein
MSINVQDSFNKIQPQCSNAFLIDENLCLSNSLNIINNNTITLSSALHELENIAHYLNTVYTLFTINSGGWLQASSNVEKNKDKWNNIYNIVNSTSANWANEFSIFYTTIYEINDWNSNKSDYINSYINDWININFPASDYSDNQIISIYVNLYQDYYFMLGTGFSAEFYHACVPKIKQGDGSVIDSFTKTVKCDGTTCGGRPSRGCNHHGGKAGNGPCDNAYDHCGAVTTGGGPVYYTCPAYGAQQLSLQYNGDGFTDRIIIKTEKIKYKKQPDYNVWTPLI